LWKGWYNTLVKEGGRIIRGVLTAAVLSASLQLSKPTEAQTPPDDQPDTNTTSQTLYIPYIAPLEKLGAPIFPPSTPTPKEVFYESPKVTPLMESCNDKTPDRKLTDAEITLSPFKESVFPPPGFHLIAIARSSEGFEKGEYVEIGTFSRRLVITPQSTEISNQREIPIPPVKAGETVYVSMRNEESKYIKYTVYQWVACPPKQ